MRTIAAATFLAGIAIGVIVSFFGLERRRGSQIRLPHPALNLGSFAPSLIVWGAVTYVLERGGWLGSGANAAIGVAAATVAWVGTSTFLARWALREDVARASAEAEAAELLQGHIAKVVAAIGSDAPGEIAYELDGQRHRVRARSVDDSAIANGTDVVIERIDDGVAYVEPWSAVEQRL